VVGVKTCELYDEDIKRPTKYRKNVPLKAFCQTSKFLKHHCSVFCTDVPCAAYLVLFSVLVFIAVPGNSLIVLVRVLMCVAVPRNSLLVFFAVLVFIAVPGNLLLVFFAVLMFVAVPGNLLIVFLVAPATMVLP
jgi:hypothetical protein